MAKLTDYTPMVSPENCKKMLKVKRVNEIDAPPAFVERWPNCFVLCVVTIIDNSDIGVLPTYKTEMAVYTHEVCLASSMVSPGFGVSGRWHRDPDVSEAEAALEVLHLAIINDAYRRRQESWRRHI